MNRNNKWLALLAALWAASFARAGAEPVDAIYAGGTVLTMNEAQRTAEAVAVREGRIVAVGARSAIEGAYRARERVDLAGGTLLPGFIDAHSHFVHALLLHGMANIGAPPAGPARDLAEIVTELRRFAESGPARSSEFLLGYGYDPDQMPPGQELDRDALDAAFPDRPVFVMHVSLHGAVLNSAALRRFGIDAGTPTPPGGLIVRKPGSNEPAGLIMETAFLPVAARLPRASPEQQLAQLDSAQLRYAAAGITTIQDGATLAGQLAMLEQGAERGLLWLDLVSYAFGSDIEKVLATRSAERFGRYRGRLKLGGCKLLIDGSPQARTAFFTTPYLGGGPDGERDWRGAPLLTQSELDAMLGRCYGLGLHTLVHANGDAAIDMLLAAHERVAAASLDADRRTTVIHAQFVRADQLRKFARYRMIPSFFTGHAFLFSSAHLRYRGREQAFGLSPMRSALALGLRPTDHTDFTVTPLDQMLMVWSAVTRQARDGSVIGPEERIDAWQALRAITIDAAWQYREEASKGSIEPGKLADLVVLSANPLEVAPDAIRAIRVLRTIKDGRTVWPR